jgi:uncharacterized protein
LHTEDVMVITDERVPESQRELKAFIRHAFPHLAPAETADLLRIAGILVRAFQPEKVYVFGSQARGTPSQHSDMDLLVVVPDAGEFPHRLAQEAYRVIGHHALPLDIVFMDQAEFDWRADVVTSLPATVLREGRLLCAA